MCDGVRRECSFHHLHGTVLMIQGTLVMILLTKVHDMCGGVRRECSFHHLHAERLSFKHPVLHHAMEVSGNIALWSGCPNSDFFGTKTRGQSFYQFSPGTFCRLLASETGLGLSFFQGF